MPDPLGWLHSVSRCQMDLVAGGGGGNAAVDRIIRPGSQEITSIHQLDGCEEGIA